MKKLEMPARLNWQSHTSSLP